MSLEILIGCDPEVFMMKDGRYVSAHGAIPGDKANPYKVDKGAVQVDGMALEFNIDPASTAEEFVENINTVMATLRSMVPGYELAAVPVADFGAEHMAQQPPEALILGCEPDFDAWNGGKPNPKPDGERTFRTGAGHIHIGWTNGMDVNDPDHLEACMMVVRQLDVTLGVASLLWDDDHQRRTMYGALGCFRPKPYGVEYRVLSNAWVKSPELAAWVFEATKKAVEALYQGDNKGDFWDRFAKRVFAKDKLSYEDMKSVDVICNQMFGSVPPIEVKQPGVVKKPNAHIYDEYFLQEVADVIQMFKPLPVEWEIAP